MVKLRKTKGERADVSHDTDHHFSHWLQKPISKNGKDWTGFAIKTIP